MKNKIKIIIVTILLLTVNTYCYALNNICFSPSKCCQQNVIELINNAKKEIDIGIYSFTDKMIFNALMKAIERDVKVYIVYDYRQSKQKHSMIHLLQALNNDNVKLYTKKKTVHIKYIIIDNEILLRGSYNFTNNATYSNNEECSIERDQNIVKLYKDNLFNIIKTLDN